MFCSNPDFVPSFVNLKDGSCQIADLGSASYMGDWHRAFKSQPTLLGSRTVVEQWGMSPVTNDNELQLLQIAYRRAIGIDESLEEHRDIANDIAHELVNQLPDVDDYRGSIVRQFEDYKNDVRRKRGLPTGYGDLAGILRYVYPTSNQNTHSLYKDFSAQTLATADNKIVYDNEFLRYLNVWGVYKHKIMYRPPKDHVASEFYINYPDYQYDRSSDETKSKLDLPAPILNLQPTFIARSGSAALSGGGEVTYVTPEAASVRRQIRDLENDLLSIPCDRSWFGQGRKHEVPKDACFVGHYCDYYVWVRADGLKELSNLTIKTLKFASLIKSESVMTIPGPRFTPSSGFPSL
jgi:hypothetical protein